MRRTFHRYWTPEELAAWQEMLDFSDDKAAKAIGLTSVTYYRRLLTGKAPINKRLAQSALYVATVHDLYSEVLGNIPERLIPPKAPRVRMREAA